MSRADLALPEPPSGPFAFPSTEFPPGVPLFRAHNPDLGVWWWGSAPRDPRDGGRHDLPDPDGTCYLALDAQTALRERLAKALLSVKVIGATEVASTALTQVEVPWEVKAADTASIDAEGIITRELATTSDYGLTQRWAAAFHRIGMDAVLAESRFTSRVDATSFALFGKAGDDAKQRRGTLPDGVQVDVKKALGDMGVTVSGGFPVAAATVIDPQA